MIFIVWAADEGYCDLWKENHVKGHNSKDRKNQQHVENNSTNTAQAKIRNDTKCSVAFQNRPRFQVKHAWNPDGSDHDALDGEAYSYACHGVGEWNWDDASAHNRRNDG